MNEEAIELKKQTKKQNKTVIKYVFNLSLEEICTCQEKHNYFEAHSKGQKMDRVDETFTDLRA